MEEEVIILATLEVRPEKELVFEHTMAAARTKSLKEDGVLTFEIFRVQGKPCLYAVYERYRNKAAFDEHLSQPDTMRTLGILDTILVKPVLEYLTFVSPIKS